jgi:hypothetical protein
LSYDVRFLLGLAVGMLDSGRGGSERSSKPKTSVTEPITASVPKIRPILREEVGC